MLIGLRREFFNETSTLAFLKLTIFHSILIRTSLGQIAWKNHYVKSMTDDICFWNLPTYVTYAKILTRVRDHVRWFTVVIEPWVWSLLAVGFHLNLRRGQFSTLVMKFVFKTSGVRRILYCLLRCFSCLRAVCCYFPRAGWYCISLFLVLLKEMKTLCETKISCSCFWC